MDADKIIIILFLGVLGIILLLALFSSINGSIDSKNRSKQYDIQLEQEKQKSLKAQEDSKIQEYEELKIKLQAEYEEMNESLKSEYAKKIETLTIEYAEYKNVLAEKYKTEKSALEMEYSAKSHELEKLKELHLKEYYQQQQQFKDERQAFHIKESYVKRKEKILNEKIAALDNSRASNESSNT